MPRIYYLGCVMLPYLGLDHCPTSHCDQWKCFQEYLIHKWLWTTFLPNPTANHFDHSRNVRMWPRGHTCTHMPVFLFSFCFPFKAKTDPRASLTSALTGLSPERLGQPKLKPGGCERSEQQAPGWLPASNSPTYWFCSPAVNWAPCVKAGWPRPSWLRQQTCPRRICNQEVGISVCSSPGPTSKCHVSFSWYKICKG